MNSVLRRSIISALLAISTLAACQQEVRQAPVLTPLAFHATAEESRPFTLLGLEFNIRRGQDIGGFQGNLTTCVASPTRVTWNLGRSPSGLEWADRFYEVFRDLGYPVVGNPANPLEREREKSRAEYVVMAQVTGLELAVCDHVHPLWGYPLGVSGSAWIDVNWQVMSNLERRVVYEGKTQGTGVVEQPARGGWEPLVLAAFEAAAHNLGAVQEFHSIASGQHAARRMQAATAQSGATAAIRLAGPLPSRAPIQERMGQARAAVPTIDVGLAHGSGVFITNDGYLLTNDHVVTERKSVIVRLQGGIELQGEVIKTHPVRDIALVKVAINGAPAVPVRATGLEVGDEVYAIGTPLERSLGQTVTRGIVSAIRNQQIRGTTQSHPIIQSDVTIQGGNSGGGLFDRNGNLVGISVSGIGEMNSGTNFFIPIGDALAKLGVELGAQGRPTIN